MVLTGRDEKALGVVADELLGLGATAVDTAVCDVTDTASHAALAAETPPMRWARSTWSSSPPAPWATSDATRSSPGPRPACSTPTSPVPAAAMVAFAEVLRAQGHGRIVVLSSVAGVRVRRANFVYGASKAGLDAFAIGLGEALRGTGASVMVVRPGWVATKMTAGLTPGPLATTADAVAADVVAGMGRGADRGLVAGAASVGLRRPPAAARRRSGGACPAERGPRAGPRLGTAAHGSGPAGHDVQADVVDDRVAQGRGHRVQEGRTLVGGHGGHERP